VLLYLVRLDLAPGTAEAIGAWFTARHAPDLVAAGLDSAVAYASLDGLTRHHFYDITGPDVLQTQVYRDVSLRDPDKAGLMSTLLGSAKSINRRCSDARRVAEAPTSSHVALSRFDHDDVAAVQAWSAELSRALPAGTTADLYEHVVDHDAFAPAGPRWTLLLCGDQPLGAPEPPAGSTEVARHEMAATSAS
jgi:hypothetical protein